MRIEKEKDILKECNRIYTNINKNKKEIVNLLTEYESYETVMDEVNKSLDTLKNINKEFMYFPDKDVNILSTFLPINLPLYSLILFAVVPSLYTRKVFVRPPLLAEKYVNKISSLIGLPKNVFVVIASREEYLKDYVSKSNVVVFTGKYVNAVNIIESIPNDILFLNNGAGVNPVLVTESCNLKKAVEKSIYVKMFNSGQDCAGPDAILVHAKIFKSFYKALTRSLDEVKVGSYKKHRNIVGRLVDSKQLVYVADLFDRYKSYIKYGGTMDFKQSIIYPTVMVQDIRKDKLTFEEYFSPVFKIIKYHNDKDLDMYFQHPVYLQNAMYVSVFGKSKYVDKIKYSNIIQNRIIHEVEFGNQEYGGYSKKASFVHYKKEFYKQPILISREISSFLKL